MRVGKEDVPGSVFHQVPAFGFRELLARVNEKVGNACLGGGFRMGQDVLKGMETFGPDGFIAFRLFDAEAGKVVVVEIVLVPV